QVLHAPARHPHRQEGLPPHPLHARPAPQAGSAVASGARRARTPVNLLTIVIDLNPNIIRIGPLLITWHGVFSVLGIIAAARLGFWLLERDGVELKGGGGDGLAWMVIVGLVGARLLYVWENFRLFAGGQVLRVFSLPEGGISQ